MNDLQPNLLDLSRKTGYPNLWVRSMKGCVSGAKARKPRFPERATLVVSPDRVNIRMWNADGFNVQEPCLRQDNSAYGYAGWTRELPYAKRDYNWLR